MGPAFQLDPRLDADTHFLARWGLCCVLLMDDANYPWLVLVPERPGLVDFHDLAPGDLTSACDEVARASRALQALFKPHKINVAALGNQVRQLHIHVIARFTDDKAWPKPVWGAVPPQPYTPDQLRSRAADLTRAFASL